MSTCPIVGDVNFGHSISVVSTSFLHHRVTVFPFVINKYLIGKFFEAMQIYVSCSSSHLHPLVLTSIDVTQLHPSI